MRKFGHVRKLFRKLRTKLLLSNLLLLSVVALIGLPGYLQAKRIKAHFDILTESITPSLEELGHIRSSAFRLLEAVSSYWLLSDLGPSAQGLLNGEKFQAQQNAQLLQEATERYAKIVRQPGTTHPKRRRITMLAREIAIESLALLEKLESGQQLSKVEAKDLLEELEEKLNAEVGFALILEKKALEERRAESLMYIARIYTNQVFMLGGGLMTAFVIGLLLAKTLTDPLERLKAAVNAVSSGRLDARLRRESNDELGDLAEAFNQMVERLRGTTISKRYLDQVFSSMHEAVLVCGEGHRIESVNDAASSMLGMEAGAAIGLHCDEVFDRLSSDNGEGDLRRAAEAKLKRADGGELEVSLSSSQLHDSRDGKTKLLLVARDISVEKKIEAELKGYRARLARAQQLASVGTLGAIIAHKLNQPLTSLRLFLQQSLREIENEGGGEPTRQKLRDCLEEVSSMSSMIKELFDSTRRPFRQRNDQIRLSGVAERTRLILEAEAAQAGLSINAEGLEELPDISGNSEQIEEMFFLLYQNAIEAARPGSELRVRGKLTQREIALEFADTGRGIPEELLPRIFDVFFSSKGGQANVGLGLSIVQQIVNNHLGDIRVESQVGVGTTFRILLPV